MLPLAGTWLSAAIISTAGAWRLLGTSAPSQVLFTAADVSPSRVHEAVPGTRRAITPEISAFAEKLLRERHVPGLSVGVVHLREGAVHTEVGTWGNSTEDGDPVQQDTLFSIGSCSKAFLASALGILIDDFATGKNVTALPAGLTSFTWDTNVEALLPGDWKLADEWASQKANIRDILSHVSGLTRHDTSYHRDDTPLEVIRRLRYLRPAYELRQHWSYNNQMFIVGSYIVSTYSGKSFREFVKERIFGPLNMTATTYSGSAAEASGLLSQSWSNGGRRIPYWFDEATTKAIAGAGGIISSVVDMNKWVATLLNGGVNPYNNETVIPKATYVEITTAHSIVVGAPPNELVSIKGYGLGWGRTSYQGHDWVGHSGGLPGFFSQVIFLPADGLGVVAFVNRDGPHGVEAIIPIRIVEDFLELRYRSPFFLSNMGDAPHVKQMPAPQPFGATPAVVHCATAAEDSTSTLVIERFAGTYFDPGYGSLLFCASTSVDPGCARVLADFATISQNGTVDANTLYGSSMSVWGGHIRMRRICAGPPGAGYESFGFSVGTIFPDGYGRDTTPFAQGYLDSDEIEVRCVLDEGQESVVGCGMMNIEEARRTTVGSIEETADVWFSKVD